MAPTPLAKAIIGRVRAALQDLESTLTEGLAFDPRLATRIFTMASRDVMEAAALPQLMQRLQTSAPQVQLRSLRVARKDMESALASGQIDFAADVLLPVSDQIRHQALGSETLVVVMRQGHPLASNRLNLDDYVNSRHILVSSRTEGQGVEDFALTRLGKVRQVTLRCQNYYAAVQVVANTDLLLTLPRTYAEQMQVQTGHIIQPLPLPLEPLEIQLYWHVKSTRDPAVMWMKEQMVDLF